MSKTQANNSWYFCLSSARLFVINQKCARSIQIPSSGPIWGGKKNHLRLRHHWRLILPSLGGFHNYCSTFLGGSNQIQTFSVSAFLIKFRQYYTKERKWHEKKPLGRIQSVTTYLWPGAVRWLVLVLRWNASRLGHVGWPLLWRKVASYSPASLLLSQAFVFILSWLISLNTLVRCCRHKRWTKETRWHLDFWPHNSTSLLLWAFSSTYGNKQQCCGSG